MSPNAYNIRIIHDGEFYAENDIHDPHDDNFRGYIIQHMTEEAEHFTKSQGGSPAVKKIIQELIIKGDVRDKLISIFDWRRLDSGKEWAFVIRRKNKTEFRKSTEHTNDINKKVYSNYNYYRLKIDSNGELEFDTFCDSGQDDTEEWSKICYAYDFVEKRHCGAKNQVEGLVCAQQRV